MKKFICVLLSVSILFSLAACNIQKAQPESSTAAPSTTDPYHLSIVRDKSLRKEFTADDGSVSYVVEAVLPEIFGGCDESSAVAISNYYLNLYEDALQFAEFNVENAATYMKNLGSEKPWTRKLSYEVTFCNKEYLCITFYDRMPLTADAVVTTNCIKLSEGVSYSLTAFSGEGGLSEASLDVIEDSFIALAEEALGSKLTQAQLDAIEKSFDQNRFCFDEERIYFIIPKSSVDLSLAGEGLFAADFLWTDFGDELKSPFA